MADATSSWEIASTVATAAATLAALTVPFILDWLQRKGKAADAEKARLDATAEVLFAVEEALSAYDDAHKELQAEQLSQRTLHLRDVEERGWRASQVIKHLMKRADLTDGVVRCAVDGAALGIETGKAIQLAYSATDDARASALSYWEFHCIRAERVEDQVKALRSYHRLPARVAHTEANSGYLS